MTILIFRVADDDLHVLPLAGHVLHLHQPRPLRLPQPKHPAGDYQVSQGPEGVAGVGDHQDRGDHRQYSDQGTTAQGIFLAFLRQSKTYKIVILFRRNKLRLVKLDVCESLTAPLFVHVH